MSSVNKDKRRTMTIAKRKPGYIRIRSLRRFATRQLIRSGVK